MANPNVTTGASITFSSGFLAKITNISWGGIARPSVATSHMGTAAAGAGKFGNATFIPGRIIDPGELSVELLYDPELNPPIAGAIETVTVTWPDGDTWAGSAFMTGFEITGPLDDAMTATATLKFSGEVTMTD